uniref:Candidate secreted effector n=1 Tax=Meloidogyne incognita TaxID=6306 RepID=A0A914MDJ7_MELIC
MNKRIFFPNEVLTNSIFANQSIRNSLVRFYRKIVVVLYFNTSFCVKESIRNSNTSFRTNRSIRKCNTSFEVRSFFRLFHLCSHNRVNIVKVLILSFDDCRSIIKMFFFFFLFFSRYMGRHFNVNIGVLCRFICS